MMTTDTIFALATPTAKSGVAIFRLSGKNVLRTIQHFCGLESPIPRHAYYASFSDPSSRELIDRGLVLYFPAPHSFTGEDVAEFHTHGSLAVIRQMHHVLAGMEGLRQAEAGEFSRRAFIHGKMDLIKAEGLADLIESETIQQKSQALRQMRGELSDFYDTLRQDTVRCLALLEAYIDFPDEDIPESVLNELDTTIHQLQHRIADVLHDKKRGERLRDGITIAILGAPNAGKSSLLNRIAKRDAAIVSHRAGTTRDVIEIHLDIAGYPVILVDTAGIRESDDEIEREGIRRALERANASDIKLLLFDGSQWPQMDMATKRLLDDQSMVVVSKCDLMEEEKRVSNTFVHSPLFLSVQTGEGLEQILNAIEHRILHFFSGETSSLITRQRHRGLLENAFQFLDRARQNQVLELKCEELRQAGMAIGKITGKIQVDDVLEVIFKSFCIGK